MRDPRQDPHKIKITDYPIPYWDIGILKAGNWEGFGYAGLASWFNTNAFYQFATKEIGKRVLSYTNPPQYIDGQTPPSDENKWLDQLHSARPSIQPGDLVFYGDGSNWAHVAIIVGWDYPTNFGVKNDPGSDPSGTDHNWEMLKKIRSLECRNAKYAMSTPPLSLRPVVVERSGAIAYTTWRSLDNTSSLISVIDIVHIENRLESGPK